MIEIAVVGISLVVAEVAKGVAGEAGKSVWQGVVSAYQRLRGTKPEPKDIDETSLKSLYDNDAELRALALGYSQSSPVIRRSAVVQKALRGARVLWVDDNPSWNNAERTTLEGFGVVVVPVTDTALAKDALRGATKFDLVLSDISRGGSNTEGVDALAALKRESKGAPVIFYVDNVTAPLPLGAFGITAAPGELMHLCMDALERTRL